MRNRLYDRAFEPAVAQGYLTAQQAWSRGNREAYAIGLQLRYDLSPALALQVADNRLRLHDALCLLDRQRTKILPEALGDEPAVRRKRAVAAVVLLGATLAMSVHTRQLWNHHVEAGRQLEALSLPPATEPTAAPHARDRDTPATGAAVERDGLGRVTRVSAGTPTAVVGELCRLASPTGTACGFADVRHTEPRYPGRRVGRFIEPVEHADAIWVVQVRRDGSSGRWFAGTGLQPVTPVLEAGEVGQDTVTTTPDRPSFR